MTIVVAAMDADAAALPTLQAAELMASVYGADVDVVHVVAPGWPPARCRRRSLTFPCTSSRGASWTSSSRSSTARTRWSAPSGREPIDPETTGHVALGVVARVDKPVAIVPPEWDIPGGSRLRVLVPLDGRDDADLTVRAAVARATHADVDVVLLHVFDPASVPPFLDRPEHDLPAWSHRFPRRHLVEQGASVIWRTGSPAGNRGRRRHRAHRWRHPGVGRVLEPGRAAVVRDVLAEPTVPALLVPRAQAERTLAEA